MTKITQSSDRIRLVMVKAEPVNLVLIQVYMPTTDAEDEEMELMYKQIEDLVKYEEATDQTIIMGDW